VGAAQPGAVASGTCLCRTGGHTVRTLHHDDQLGLLKPRRRSTRGYRLYQRKDLERIEQIVAVKFLGLPLSEIRRVLDGEPLLLGEEQTALREKRRLLDRALAAMGEAQLAIQQGKPAAVLLPRMIETIARQNDAHWMMNYYSPTAQGKIAERAASFTPERPARRSEAGKEYYRDLAALKEQDDPKGAKAAELSKR
jgi:MerR family transcriptional regulator, thiopeptide resistance regulator